MTFVKAAAITEVKKDKSKVVTVNGKEIALFNVDGKIYAIQNHCPHRSGPLGEGVLEGEVVACPWHGWRFNVTNGKNAVMPVSVKTYEVKVEDGNIFVEV
jgi:NAD(P)H-dependent nitrite reductase small subunit